MTPRSKAAASLFLLILLAGCADDSSPGVEAGATSRQLATEGPSAFPNQGELNDIAARVRQLGEGALALIYAGIAIDVHDDRVDVWVTDPPRFRAAIGGMPWTQRVRLHPARHAAADLEPTFQRILREQDHWRQQGLPVVQSGVRHDGATLASRCASPCRPTPVTPGTSVGDVRRRPEPVAAGRETA
ncbi:hypothetical protein [Micromonospora sagamiensis]|uniref:Uncharacterized protein n=1 Tax=Micromonospora sagamiensis TaxID=47875 RepID=A0A562WDF5_9ACTN|nr:hypothetical protein [Micromonospora sagamiensis]TWJ28323.1 hypothetical protein JD81_01827 [Micromonospora sagamiensis]